MCLYPILMRNKKYTTNKKNGGNVPVLHDKRLQYVTAACGKCIECREQKGRGWMIRMAEEQRHNPDSKFITLTVSDENYDKIAKKYNLKDANEIATKMMRLFLERARQRGEKAIKHWFITEMGHENTKRMHMHGIIWDKKATEICLQYWQYGHVYIGEYVSEKTIRYIVKYMTKVDIDNIGFEGKVLCSAGIGRGYIDRYDAINNRFRGERTKETYTFRNGLESNLPTYYRNKIYDEDEREELWKQKLDKGIIYVRGKEVQADDWERYERLLKQARKEQNELWKYNPEIKWDEEKYKKRLEKQREDIKRKK